jgi:DNA-binding MarR family transcriptional regulator
MTAMYNEALAEAGLTLAQFSLLRVLDRIGPSSLVEFGRAADLERTTVGRDVRVLERAGLVERQRGADRREVTVTVSERGQATLATAVPLWKQAQREIETTMGLEGAHDFRSVLNAI